jgi:hypothetical protein
MRVRVRPLLAAVAAAALLLSGCGIPDNSEVVTEASGASSGLASIADNPRERPRRADATDPKELVQAYLRAAAAVDQETALKQVRDFFSPSATFNATGDIKVVHADDPVWTPGSDEVKVSYRTVGVLTHNGVLDPSSDTGVTTISLTVSKVNGGEEGYFITKAPSVLLLTDEAFESFYSLHTIYFWNRERTSLVPDLRYLSTDVPDEQYPQEIIGWMIEGPSSWLADAVEPLPDGTKLQGNVPKARNEKLQISLSAQAVQSPAGKDDKGALDRLRRQLMWSLREELPRVLELKIGTQEQVTYDTDDYLTSNNSSRLAESPERFVIFDGKIRRMARSTGAGEPIPVITPAANRNVKAAALARSPSDRRYAALVTAENSKHTLRTGSAPAGEQASLTATPLPSGTPGQPVWAITSDAPQTGAIGLITIGGRLYSFTPEGQVRAVDWAGPSGSVSSVSVAPDGRRVALVIGKTVYVTAMTADGDGPEFSTLRRTDVFPLASATAVDWSSEDSVMVSGIRTDNGLVGMYEARIDGSSSGVILKDIGTAAVTQIACYPISPTSGKALPGVIEYMANGATFDIVSGAPESVTSTELADAASTNPNGIVPVGPFFLR